MTKKMGRPKLPGAERRGKFLVIRLRLDEQRAIVRAARKAGARHTDWARSALLRAAARST